ncbi:MAG: PD-(D/E)XK nuclease family protein [Acidobacteriota bacterium]|nr:PD-(D/E)XK nuclease family protein [Acidobacteriota bacterium]MDH3784511.1 PD-(D/E)XK nuclease family protein [Acidobacteriota bacterium]
MNSDMLKFDESTHTYTYDGRKLISVTQFLSRFFAAFDGPRIARKVVLNPNSKYHGRDPDELVAEWEANGQQARELGTLLHNNIQQHLVDGDVSGERSDEFEHFESFIADKPWRPLMVEEQVCCPELGIAGTVDAVFEDRDGAIIICDWKRAKKMKFDNRWQKARPPIEHLDDCDLSKYSLQLSLYRHLLRERIGERSVSLRLVNFTDRHNEIPIREHHDEVQALLQTGTSG